MRAAWLEVVLKRFAEATSFASAKEMMTTLEPFDRIPLEMLRNVEPALRTKVDLREAYGVPDRFRNLLTKPGGRHHERGNAPVVMEVADLTRPALRSSRALKSDGPLGDRAAVGPHISTRPMKSGLFMLVTRFGREGTAPLNLSGYQAVISRGVVSLVERPVRDRKVAGSNPVATTTQRRRRLRLRKHDFGRLHDGRDRVAFLQMQVFRAAARDHRFDHLRSDFDRDVH